MSIGTPNYITDLGTSTYLDYYIEIDIDGTDANSAPYRPTSSYDLRITATMPDSVNSADLTTLQDAFTVTLEDECMNN